MLKNENLIPNSDYKEQYKTKLLLDVEELKTLVVFQLEIFPNERLIPAIDTRPVSIYFGIRFGVMYPEALQTRDILSWTGARASCIDRIDFSLQNSANEQTKIQIHRLCVSIDLSEIVRALMNNDYAEDARR